MTIKITHSDATKQGLGRRRVECAGACHESIEPRDAKTRPKTRIHGTSPSRARERCRDRLRAGPGPKIEPKMGPGSQAPHAPAGSRREKGKKREKQRAPRRRGNGGSRDHRAGRSSCDGRGARLTLPTRCGRAGQSEKCTPGRVDLSDRPNGKSAGAVEVASDPVERRGPFIVRAGRQPSENGDLYGTCKESTRSHGGNNQDRNPASGLCIA